MIKFLFMLFCLCFIACGGKNYIANDVKLDSIESKNIESNLPQDLQNLVLNLQNTPPQNPVLLGANSTPLGMQSMPLSIFNPMGSALTLWALAAGNWIWGYTLDYSKSFGTARIWRIINLGNDIVLIRNEKSGNCINDEGSGITHRPCSRENKAQQWKLLGMDNGAAQIRSMSSGRCIRTEYGSDITDLQRYFSITLETCETSANYDQQWIFIPPPLIASPLLGGAQ